MSESQNPTVAAFDLDGTLSEGGSVVHWLRFIAGTRATYSAGLSLLTPLTIGAIKSGSAADSAKERLFHKLLAGRDVADVQAKSREFILQHLESNGRAHVVARLRWHLDQGHKVVIVSASPQLYVDVVGETLGANGGCGTRLGVDARNKLTGMYLGKNCRGSEKIRRLNEWISEQGFASKPVVYAYGNSRGDLKMLTSADYGFDCGKLGRFGALKNFSRLEASLLLD
jgi:HAD superfamily hydrolase (TIGR01490 family)